MESIINLLKKIRKQQNLRRDYSSKYAFVGIGNHSLNNLYPVLNYLNVPLKYIVAKSQSTANVIGRSYRSVIGTIDYDAVLSDAEIGGVLISANPNAHYDLVKKALMHKKNVFVEKPPCTTSEELDDLIQTEKESGKTCVIGLQKRYSTCADILKKELTSDEVISYNYRFAVGAYPDGDALWDLFIHPVDLLSFLFGSAELLSVAKTKTAKGQMSVFLHTQHGKAIGSIELSTQYAWNQADEHMTINTAKGIYKMDNFQSLTFSPKPGTIFSIPKEKILPTVAETKYLFNANNFLPIVENNQLITNGFFSEINTFINICEDKKAENKSSLKQIRPTFELLSEIKNNSHE